MLRPKDDGSYEAECLMLPGCTCVARSRQQALEKMQDLLSEALREEKVGATRYEIVYLAVGRSS